MLKIKTLEPKQSKMKNYIKKHGLNFADVARCFGVNGQWFNEKLNNNKFGAKDEATIKKLVDKLAKRK